MKNTKNENFTFADNQRGMSEKVVRLLRKFGNTDFTLKQGYEIIFTDNWANKSDTERQGRGRLFSKTEEYERFGLRIYRKCKNGKHQTYCIDQITRSLSKAEAPSA